MEARALFLLLLFVSQTIYADNTKSLTDSKVNDAVTTVGVLAFLMTKAGLMKGFLLGSSGLVVLVAKIGVAVGIVGYGIKKGWDWYAEREKIWKEVKKLKKNMEELKKGVKEVGNDVKEVGKKTDSVQNELAESRKEIRERFDRVDGNVEDLRTGQGSIKEMLNTFSTRQQVEQLSDSQKTQLEKLIVIINRMDAADGARKEILNATDENRSKVTSLLQSMNFCKGEISELKKILNSSERADELSEIRKIVDRFQESQGSLHMKLDALLEIVQHALPSNDSMHGRLKKLTKRSRPELSDSGIFYPNRVAEEVEA